MARKRRGRAINGVLLLNKPAGMSSNHALQRAKRLFFAAKAGHTGSLDPLATGVLPLCFGEATKFSQFLLDSDKGYRSTFQLGVTTDTSDADGEVLSEQPTTDLTREQVEQALRAFEGDIEQIPSMFSALKHQGQPLYKLAREGKEVERAARQVTVHDLKVLDFRPGSRAEVDVEVLCTKGTYIRSIAEDLGQALGCGAHVKYLHRIQAGPFLESQTVSLDELNAERGEGLAEVLDHHLLPMDAPVAELPSVELPEGTGYYFGQGNPVMENSVHQLAGEGDMLRVFLDSGEFLGLGGINDDGLLAPKRLVVRDNSATNVGTDT